tara:strand:+ start:120 stop:596 length:477 start_codon:yes stop_codon:yes gene_type:complete
MSKNLQTILLSVFTAIAIVAIILNKDNNNFEKPMVLDENVIWIDFKDESMDIWMKNNAPVYGLQFEFSGVNLKGTDGGVLNREGFNISNNERVILSFSFEGKSIEPGEYLLISVDASYLIDKNNVKMTNMVLAGNEGKSLDFSYFDTNFNTTTLRTNN